MAIFEIFLLLTFVTISFCVMLSKTWKRSSSLPTNWPLLGMLPGLAQNSRRIHAFATELLSESNGTFEFKGPWFCNMDMLITSDPANIHHIFSKNFSNYPKGPEFRKIFEILGDGIFNADFELWEFHRRTTLSFMNHEKFYTLLESSVWEKVETGLIPILDYFSEQRIDFDLQDIFQRLTFDSICKMVLDYDPGSLSTDLPYVPCEKAFNDAIEALLHRHILPESIWKLQKWLGIGKERKLTDAWKAFDKFIYPCIPSKEKTNDFNFNLLKAFKKAYEEKNGSLEEQRNFLRDTSLSLMFAGRDTTSTCLTWLFWLIATNPVEESKIREEIETELKLMKNGNKWRFFNVQESRKLIYLHGALSESLRLFPPVALEHKAPILPDVLPSGNHIQENSKVIISFYSMGRMESIWGKDCLEFKPERWISARGRTKHEPSYKFPAFNAGPRTCLGKEMAFIQMKMVAATIIYNYDIQLVKGHSVSPRDSIILQAKDGLKVKLCKRNV
ncbi:hypothetical protein ACJIZ3_012919 [Penstemon smallii]|uniref:Cytochrome P450 n=1 Tax=Penstemon smallii TaxID=265156 RepID=A0ABD3UPH9_9LAMI